MIAIAAVVGYLIGSLPTAGWLARAWGVDLRAAGSGNPGAANALRVAGGGLAAWVLVTEIIKGAGAVSLGVMFDGDWGVVAAGLGAATGNVVNIWYKGGGGKGLGISSGVTLVAWPVFYPIALGVVIAAVVLTRSAGKAGVAGLAVYLVGASAWVAWSLPRGWGIEHDVPLLVMALGIVIILLPRLWRDARSQHPATG